MSSYVFQEKCVNPSRAVQSRTAVTDMVISKGYFMRGRKAITVQILPSHSTVLKAWAVSIRYLMLSLVSATFGLCVAWGSLLSIKVFKVFDFATARAKGCYEYTDIAISLVLKTEDVDWQVLWWEYPTPVSPTAGILRKYFWYCHFLPQGFQSWFSLMYPNMHSIIPPPRSRECIAVYLGVG